MAALHLILPVSDVEASVRFYHRTLGFKYEPEALVRVTSHLVLQLIPQPPRVQAAAVLDLPYGARQSFRIQSGGNA